MNFLLFTQNHICAHADWEAAAAASVVAFKCNGSSSPRYDHSDQLVIVALEEHIRSFLMISFFKVNKIFFFF